MSARKNVEDIVQFLVRTLSSTRAKGFVLGLSGGIDSAVVAGLAKIAVDRANRPSPFHTTDPSSTIPTTVYKLKTVIMPINSNPQDEAAAKLVASSLGLDAPQTVYMIDAFNEMCKALGADSKTEDRHEIKTLGNVKARMRMTALSTTMLMQTTIWF